PVFQNWPPLYRTNRPENLFQALVPAPLAGSRLIGNQALLAYASGTNVFNSHQGEVAYFLVSSGQNANGTPMHKLMRRLRLAVHTYLGTELNTDTPTPTPPAPYATPPYYRVAGTEPVDSEVSCKNDPVTGGMIYFNTLADLTVPERRLGTNPVVGSAGLPL